MASDPLTFTLSPGMAPAAPLLRLLSRFDRQKVEAFAEVSIALLDLVDGDPDLERGDAEDDFTLHPAQPWHGPGCAIADPNEDDDDDHEHDGREELHEF